MNRLETFSGREALTAVAADRIAGILKQAVAARGAASFACSGGSTPGSVFDQLCQDGTVPWDKVSVLLSDERQADMSSGLRNEQLVRDRLLKGEAADARFFPVAPGPLAPGIPVPLDLVLLGMGVDGHFASIFPEGEGMDAAWAEDAPDVVETTPAPLPPEAPVSRYTFSWRVIREARSLILLIAGDAKKDVFDRAPQSSLPISRLLAEDALPLQILWSP